MPHKRSQFSRRHTRELELKLLEGLDSPARLMGPTEWSKLRRTLRAKLAKRRRKQ